MVATADNCLSTDETCLTPPNRRFFVFRATVLLALTVLTTPTTGWSQQGAVAWVRQIGGESIAGRDGQFPYDIEVSPDGTAVFVTGEFWGVVNFPGQSPRTSAGESDLFLAKFSVTDGTCQWVTTAGGELADRGLSLKVGSDGNLTVKGTGFGRVFFGAAFLDCQEEHAFDANFSQATGAYVSGSAVIDTHEQYDVPATHSAWPGDGKVMIGKYSFALPLGTGEAGATVLQGIAGEDAFVARYNPNNTLDWASRIAGQGNDWPTSVVALPNSAGAIVVGSFEQDAAFGALTTLVSTGGADMFVAYFKNDVIVPTANFTITPSTGTAPLLVGFNDTSTNFPTSWSWDFDNNGTIDSTLPNPSFTYALPGTYTVTLTAHNAAGSDAETKAGSVVVAHTFTSIAANDGWILELSEAAGSGGSGNATDSTGFALRVGDDDSRKQYKAVLSFDTSSLPDSVTISSATLRIYVGATSGTSPFDWPATCQVDVKTGTFGTQALQLSDFSNLTAPATATQVASLTRQDTIGLASIGSLNGAGLSAINKTGLTQFRIYFSVDDDNDSTGDGYGFYSGDHATASLRPALEVTFQ